MNAIDLSVTKRASGRRKPQPEPVPSADVDAIDAVELLAALRAFRRGDFSVRLPRGARGLGAEIAEAFNDVVELNDRMTREFERLGETVGRQGKINHRARLPSAEGSWAAGV